MVGGLTLLLAMGLATLGLGEPIAVWTGPVALAFTMTAAGGIAAVYLAAGLGLGAVVQRLVFRRSEQAPWLVLAIGPGLMLFASHGLGALGLFKGSIGQAMALGTIGLGLVALFVVLITVFRRSPNLPLPPRAALLWSPAAALLLVASASPPGWLWSSEGGNYDSLSYHLQLAQEWARSGRIEPLTHNVYSALPSYVEAGFTHLAAALGAASSVPGRPVGLLAHDGMGAIATQYLHAFMAVLAAVLVARLIWVLLEPADLPENTARRAACIGGATLLAVPWVLVVSSLSYNESAVNLLFAGAMLACLDRGLGPWSRGLAAGLLVGLAVGCKPTAAFLVTPTVGLLLLVRTPASWRSWGSATAAAVLAGTLAVAPFVVRNTVSLGNPAFPAARAVFGPAHWSEEQHDRFAAAHREDRPLVQRVGLLLAARGDGLGSQPRGVLHAQWSIFFPAGLMALILAVCWPPVRSAAIVLGAGVAAGVAWWLLGSHGQSRFLLPLAPPLAVLIGLASTRLMAPRGRATPPGIGRLGLIASATLPMVLSAAGLRIYLRENRGMPNRLLLDAAAARTGEAFRRMITSPDRQTRADALDACGPEAYVNLTIDPTSTVYLLGDATPFYYTGRVLYHTTWDRSPLAEAIRRWPGQPEQWARALAKLDVEYLMVNFAELDRLRRSGWLDPDLTPERIDALLQRAGEPRRQWPETGQVLFKLRAPRSAESELSA